MSRRVISVTIIVALLAVLVSGYIGVTYNNSSQSTGNSAQAARDSVITYLKENYPIMENWTANLAWTGGRQNISAVDAEYYVYNSSEWIMQLNCTVAPNPLYVVDANYTKDDITLEWIGVCQNGTAIEEGYVIYNTDLVTTEANQAECDIIPYLAANHQETQQHLTFLGLEGGKVAPPEGFVGSETYRYVGVAWNDTDIYPVGWTITMQHPVVPNPTYSVNITYAPPSTDHTIINWQGTWQNGTITETLYSYTPLTL